jgi:hypothetical protein
MAKTKEDTFNMNSYVLPIISNVGKELIFNSSFNYDVSKFQVQPIGSLGYTYFFHQSYENFKKIKNDREIYWIVNGFEIYLSKQEIKNELINKLNKYFGDLDSTVLLNPLFLQMWELLISHNLLDEKNTKIHIVSNLEKVVKGTIDSFVNKKINNSTVSYSKNDYNLGIFTYNNFQTTLDQEALYFPILLKNVNELLKGLKNGGNLIISLNDTYTVLTVKLICILKCIFENVIIHKPHYVRPVISDKYMVCINLSDKNYNKISKKLDKLCEKIDDSTNIVDIMSDIDIPIEILKSMAFINKRLGILQHTYQNKMITYVESGDYFGDTYHDYSDMQQLSTEYFVSTFLPINKTNYVEILKNINKNILNNSNSMNNI